MVRGKGGKEVEFGPKALLSWVDGYCFLDHFSFDAYNEAGKVKESLKKFKERFGRFPRVMIGDGIFGNRVNRELLGLLGMNLSTALEENLKGGRKSRKRQEKEDEKTFPSWVVCALASVF